MIVAIRVIATRLGNKYSSQYSSSNSGGVKNSPISKESFDHTTPSGKGGRTGVGAVLKKNLGRNPFIAFI